MGKIEDLAERFGQHIATPWQRTVAGAQRVIMVVYDKEFERTLRARKQLFELELKLRRDKGQRLAHGIEHPMRRRQGLRDRKPSVRACDHHIRERSASVDSDPVALGHHRTMPLRCPEHSSG